MTDTPSPNGSNGNGGRFNKGNAGGPGNPFAKQVANLRSALFEAVTPEDLKEVISALLRQAKAGEVASIKELLQRLLGPPESLDLLNRLEEIEQRITQLGEQRSNSWQR